MVEISNDDVSVAMIDYDDNHRDVLNASAVKLRNSKVRLGVVAIELRNPVNNGTTQIYALHNAGSHITMLQ